MTNANKLRLLAFGLALALCALRAPAASVEFRLVVHDDPATTIDKREQRRPITNPVATERGMVIETIGIDFTGWARNILLDETPIFERYHEDKYIDRLPIARRDLKPGEHRLWPGDHLFTLAADGRLSSTDPELLIEGSVVKLKAYPVVIAALRANPPEGDLPRSMRLAPLPSMTVREAANQEASLPDPVTGKTKGGKPLELLPVFDKFAPLTLWLPANTTGKGYWLHPLGMTFHLTPQGVVPGAGGGRAVEGVSTSGRTIEVPLFQYPVTGPVGTSLVAEGVESVQLRQGRSYTSWFPKADAYQLRVSSFGPAIVLDGSLRAFPEKAFALDQRDPAKGLVRAVAVEMGNRRLEPGKPFPVRVHALDPAPAILADAQVKAATAAVASAQATLRDKKDGAEAALATAQAELVRQQQALAAAATANLLADAGCFAELQPYGQENWQSLPVKPLPDGVLELSTPELPDGLYHLRVGVRGPGIPELSASLWVTLARSRPFSAGLFTPRGRTAFPRGEPFWIGLGMLKVAAAVPAGTSISVALLDQGGTRLPLLSSKTTAAIETRETLIVRLSPEGSRALAPGRYSVEAQVGDYRVRPLTLEVVETEPETHFLNMMNGKYSPQNKIYETILRTGEHAELLAADLAGTGYNAFMGMSYDLDRVTRGNLDIEQLVRERPELGPWESYYQASYRDQFLDACVRQRLRFWEDMITYNDTMHPRNTPILEATERYCTLETQSMATSPAFQGICMYDEVYGLAPSGIPEELYRSFSEWQEMMYRKQNPGLTSDRALKAFDRFAGLPAGQRQVKDVDLYRTLPAFEDQLWADFSVRGARAAKRAMPESLNFVMQRFGGSNGSNIFYLGTPYGVSKPFEMVATVMYKDGGAGDRPVFAPMQADVLRSRDDLLVTTQLHSFSDSGRYGQHILRQAFFALAQKTDGLTFFTLPHSPLAPNPQDWRDPIGDITKRLTTPYGDLFLASRKGYGRVGIYASRQADYLAGRKPLQPKVACEGLWTACVRAGYPADFLYDEHVLAGRAKEFDVLFFPGVYFEEEVPPAILQQLQAFLNAGKQLIVERGSKLPLTGIIRADSTFDEYDGKEDAFPRYIDFESEMVWDQSEELTRVVRGLLEKLKIPPAAQHNQLVGPDWLRCRDAHYLLMPNFAPTQWNGLYKTRFQAPNVASLRFPKRPPACYDVLTMKVQPVKVDGDWMETEVDMRHVSGAFLAFLPAAIEAVRLKISAAPAPGKVLHYTAGIVDAAGQTIDAGVPLEITLLAPDGHAVHRLYRAGTPEYAGAYPLPINPQAGQWTLEVRELFSGRRATASFALQPLPAPTAAVDERSVWLERKAEIQAFLKTDAVINIVLDHEQDWARPVAAELAQQLTTKGLKAKVAELDEVLRLPKPWGGLNPEIDGSRLWRGNLVEPGLFVDAPVIVLGKRNENRLIEALQRRDLLPLPVSEHFPGPGKAVLCWIPLAFSNQFQTLALLANDAAGLRQGLKALGNLDAVPEGAGVHPHGQMATADPKEAVTLGKAATPAPVGLRSTMSQEVPIAALDVDPASGRVLCGTSGYGDNLFCLDGNGKRLWQTFLPEFNVYYAKWLDGGKRVVAATGQGFFVFLLDGADGKVLKKFAATEYPDYHGYWTNGGEGAVNTECQIQINDARRQLLIAGRTGLLAVSFEGQKMWFRDLAVAIAAVPVEIEASGAAGQYQKSAVAGSFALSPDGSRVAFSEFYKVGTTVINNEKQPVWAHYPVILDTATGAVIVRNTEDPGNQTWPGGWWLSWPKAQEWPIVHTGDLEAPLLAGGRLGEFVYRPGRALANGNRLFSDTFSATCRKLDGSPVWAQTQGTLWMSSSDCLDAAENCLYRLNREGRLRCLALADGQTRWNYQLPFDGVLLPLPEGVIAGCSNGLLVKLDGKGQRLWQNDLREGQELTGKDYPAYVQAALRRDIDSTGEFFPVGEDRPGDLDKVLRLGLEQLENGDFESDAAWHLGGGKPAFAAPAQSGARALTLADKQLVSQKLARRIIPSASYLLEFYFRPGREGVSVTAGAMLDTGGGDAFTGSRFSGRPQEWTFARLAIKSPAAVKTLEIGFEAAGGEILVDHVQLRPVRFPSANLLANEALHAIEPTFVKDFRVRYSRVSAELKRSLMGRSHVVAFKQGGTTTAPTLYQEESFLHNGRLDDVGPRWAYTPDPMGFSVALTQPAYISHLVLYLNNTEPENTYEFISIMANNLDKKQEQLAALVRGNHRRFVVVEFNPALHTDHLKILPGMHPGNEDCLTEVELYGPLGGPELAGKAKGFATDPQGLPMFMGGPSHVPGVLPEDLTGTYVEKPRNHFGGPPPYNSDCTVVLGGFAVANAGGSVQELCLPPDTPDDKAPKNKKQRRQQGALQNGRSWNLGSISPTTTPVRYAGRLIAGTAEGRVHAVADNGVYLWNFATGGRVYSSPLPDGDDLYFGSDDNKLYKVDIDSGILIWEFATADKIRGAPALWKRSVLVPSWDGALYAVDADTGRQLWKSPIAKFTRSSPAIQGDRVYLGDEAGALYCLDAATGKSLWQSRLEGHVSRCPVVTPTGVLFAADQGALALVGFDGQIKWQQTLPGRLTGQPLATQSQLLIPHAAGVTVLRQADGQADTRITLPEQPGQVLGLAPYDGSLFVLAGGVNIEKNSGQSFTFQKVAPLLWEPKTETDK